MEFKDYYAILGVTPEAELKDIKAAYRKLARQYHPDVSDHADAEQKFKEVAEAWQVLKDPDKRAEYDQLRVYGHSRSDGGFEPPPGWQSGSFDWHTADAGEGFSDFFESLFGRRRQSGAGNQSFGMRGQDMQMELPVFLEELLRAEPRKIAYRIPRYDGTGKRIGEQEKNLSVRIPAGVTDGEIIRLKGQGAPGLGEGTAGDLYLHVRLVPHPLFDVEGNNLLITLPVAPWEAALGAKVEVPTLERAIQLSVPPGSQTGQKLRVKGKGLPDKLGTGDLFAVLKVVMPPNANKQARELWEQLASQADFNPRSEWRQRT